MVLAHAQVTPSTSLLVTPSTSTPRLEEQAATELAAGEHEDNGGLTPRSRGVKRYRPSGNEFWH